MLYTCTDKLPCLYKGTLVIAQSGDGMAETIIIITCLLQLTNQQRPEDVEFYAGRLVATRSIKLALVQRPPQVVQRHSIPHCLSLSLARTARRNTAALLTPFYSSASILYTSLLFACILHRLLVYSSFPPPALLPVHLPASR